MVALPDDTGAKRALYLEDLSVGDRFQSGEHALDVKQIKAFALQFDPPVSYTHLTLPTILRV